MRRVARLFVTLWRSTIRCWRISCVALMRETIVDEAGFLKISNTDEEKIAALAELICRAGDEAGTKSAALLVLMSTLENASHPKALANLAKHFAFTRCGELNFNGMVEAQLAVLESELLTDNMLLS